MILYFQIREQLVVVTYKITWILPEYFLLTWNFKFSKKSRSTKPLRPYKYDTKVLLTFLPTVFRFACPLLEAETLSSERHPDESNSVSLYMDMSYFFYCSAGHQDLKGSFKRTEEIYSLRQHWKRLVGCHYKQFCCIIMFMTESDSF